MPVIMLIRVDLPLPDLPMIATNSPAIDLEVDGVEGTERPGVGDVVLDDATQVDQVGRGGIGRRVVRGRAAPTTAEHVLSCARSRVRSSGKVGRRPKSTTGSLGTRRADGSRGRDRWDYHLSAAARARAAGGDR